MRHLWKLLLLLLLSSPLLAQRPQFGPLQVISPSASTTPFIVQGAASQSGNLAEFRASDGTVLSFVGSDGSIRAPVTITGVVPFQLLYVNASGAIASASDGIYSPSTSEFGFFADPPAAPFHVGRNAFFGDRVQIADSGLTSLAVQGQSVFGQLGLAGYASATYGQVVVRGLAGVVSGGTTQLLLQISTDDAVSRHRIIGATTSTAIPGWAVTIETTTSGTTTPTEVVRFDIDRKIQFTGNAATSAVSAAGTTALRNNAGTLQLSNNGGAWADLTSGLSGSGGANRLTYWTSASALGALVAATDGQLAIGSTSAAPVIANLTAGTAISVANGSGSITIANIGVTSLASGTAISVSSATGAVTISNTGVASATGTTNQVNVSGATGAVTFSTPQDIGTSSAVQFGSLNINGAGSAASPKIFEAGLTTTGLFWYTTGLSITVSGTERFSIDATNNATNTALYIFHNGSLKQVSVAAADSCGVGFTCLRVAN